MEIINLKNFSDCDLHIDNLSLVLGYFDGVHIGHSQLIGFAKEFDKKAKLGVLTFDKPLKPVEGSLIDLSTKEDLMSNLGVDYLFVVKTSPRFKRMSYVIFVDKVLKSLNPNRIFCGPDFRYGYDALGDVHYLKDRFSEVYVLNYVLNVSGEKISSSTIKQLIKEGKMIEARKQLGRPYRLIGRVVEGFHNGIKIGYPTANLSLLTDYVVPLGGVYATKTKFGDKTYISVTSVGKHPTIDELDEPLVETYILDYSGDLYGKVVAVDFYKRLRDEVKFADIEELKKAIAKDVLDSENFFKFES
jgi:riboflavin kinase/FMN adenylyltransferase